MSIEPMNDGKITQKGFCVVCLDDVEFYVYNGSGMAGRLDCPKCGTIYKEQQSIIYNFTADELVKHTDKFKKGVRKFLNIQSDKFKLQTGMTVVKIECERNVEMCNDGEKRPFGNLKTQFGITIFKD